MKIISVHDWVRTIINTQRWQLCGDVAAVCVWRPSSPHYSAVIIKSLSEATLLRALFRVSTPESLSFSQSYLCTALIESDSLKAACFHSRIHQAFPLACWILKWVYGSTVSILSSCDVQTSKLLDLRRLQTFQRMNTVNEASFLELEPTDGQEDIGLNNPPKGLKFKGVCMSTNSIINVK